MEPENLGKVLTIFLASSGNLSLFFLASNIGTKTLINTKSDYKQTDALSSSGPRTAVEVDLDELPTAEDGFANRPCFVLELDGDPIPVPESIVH
jgi:hypothetical protein